MLSNRTYIIARSLVDVGRGEGARYSYSLVNKAHFFSDRLNFKLAYMIDY